MEEAMTFRRLTSIALMAASLPATAIGASCNPGGHAVVLTVVGDITKTNRAGVAPFDAFIAHQSLAFDKAYAFTGDALGALEAETVALVLPFDKQRHVLTGPGLDVLLKEVGAEPGADVVAHGIDGYGVLFPAADIAALHPLVAVCRDSVPLGIGDLGPGYIVFRASTAAGQSVADDERMIWGTYLLEITRAAK